MRPIDFKASDLVRKLRYTSKKLTDVLPSGMKESEMTKEDKEKIFGSLFLCCCCGCWYPISMKIEMSGGTEYCDDCVNEIGDMS